MTLHCERVPYSRLVGEFGTPLYVYSQSVLTKAFENYQTAFAALSPFVYYAVKANGNLSIIKHFALLGSRLDIISGGKLARASAAGSDASKTISSGVSKSEAEIEFVPHAGVKRFNMESIPEIDRIQKVAERLGKTAYVSSRVNPDVDAKTHPYISAGLRANEFGATYADVLGTYRHIIRQSHLKITDIDRHIGSQLADFSPLIETCECILILVDRLVDEGIILEHLDLGDGVGIVYQDETAPDLGVYAQAVRKLVGIRHLKFILELGRSLVGNAGPLLTHVELIKHGEEKNSITVDAAMNDLMCSALYDIYHHIETVEPKNILPLTADIIGPICGTGDFLAKDCTLTCEMDDLLVVCSIGTYGTSVASNYNTCSRAAGVLINGSESKLTCRREAQAQQMADEPGCL